MKIREKQMEGQVQKKLLEENSYRSRFNILKNKIVLIDKEIQEMGTK